MGTQPALWQVGAWEGTEERNDWGCRVQAWPQVSPWSLSPFPRGQNGTLWGARELTRTSEFTRHVSVYKITGHLDLTGELMWRGQVKTHVGTLQKPLCNSKPNHPTLLLLPPKLLSSKALLKCHLLQESLQDAPSQTYLLSPSLILCHSSLHHSTHLPECPSDSHTRGPVCWPFPESLC